MNGIIIKANNKEEYDKIMVILGNLGVIWGNGRTINIKDYEAEFYDLISLSFELYNVFEGRENVKEGESVVCLIVEHNKLFWGFLDDMIKNYFNFKDYEVYNFEDFKKVYSL